MNPHYAATRFRLSAPAPLWPDAFVILSAYATTGEQWPNEENLAADEELAAELQSFDVWRVRITGYSPETGHAEPSWAADLPVETGREIGRRYRQDAIFVVEDGELGYLHCDGNAVVTWIGRFEERVDSAPAEG